MEGAQQIDREQVVKAIAEQIMNDVVAVDTLEKLVDDRTGDKREETLRDIAQLKRSVHGLMAVADRLGVLEDLRFRVVIPEDIKAGYRGPGEPLFD